MRRLLETTNAIPWEADARSWQFTYVGPQAVKLLGYALEQWFEKDEHNDWGEMIGPHYKQHVRGPVPLRVARMWMTS